MGTWVTQQRIEDVPEKVLELLTRPEAIARWTPIPFELVDFDSDRLAAGDKIRVCGTLAGRSLAFEVDVADAGENRLALAASGPIHIDVEYVARASARGSDVSARVAVSGQGLRGRVLAKATDALLAAGALNSAVGRMARELQPEPALAA